MDYQKFEENNCRICLQENSIVDWNDYLQDRGHITYKDCYYKYTQLDCIEENTLCLSTMLCCNCSNTLETIDEFIRKALETHNFLQERLALNSENNNEEIDKSIPANFETVLFSEIDTDMKPEIHNVTLHGDTSKEILNEESGTYAIIKNGSSMKDVSVFESIIEEIDSKIITEDNDPCIKLVSLNEGFTKKCFNENKQSITENSKITTKKSGIGEKLISMKRERAKDKNKNSADELQSNKATIKKNTKMDPTCCSICSKVLNSKYRAIEHEKIHAKNRERTETCVQCGLKFFNKDALNIHMLTHIENREKTRKCEFCNKAFYNTGALNIHRRIHLGQMIKCTLCTKEFYRQVDLDKHLKSHSATKINDDLKPNKKYFVRCEICGEAVRSVQYKVHTARHLNEPLAKCSICSKDFFARKSCINHLTKVHKKASGERSKFVITLKTIRYSSLYLKQNVGAFIKPE